MSKFADSFVDFKIPDWFDSAHLAGMLRGMKKKVCALDPMGT